MTDLDRIDDSLATLAFSLKASPGAYAVLLGAGVSASSGVPTAWGVTVDLASQIAQLVNPDVVDPVRWYESTHDRPARYETLLEAVAQTPLERQRLLRGYFEPTADDVDAGRKVPTAAHHSIARLVRGGSVRVIVTLNFDRLMERALWAEGVEPTVITSASEISGMAPLHSLECCVVHLHGDYLNPTSMRNTVSELKEYEAPKRRLLQRILQDYGLVIAGWSSRYDPALRAAIDRYYPLRRSLTWIEQGDPTEEAVELCVRKRGQFLSTNADEGFGRLADAVQMLTLRDARHPLTVPVAVETAKRELSGQHVAIGLHDTLSREFTRLHDHAGFHRTDHQSTESDGGYQAIVERIDEASTMCSALVATLAYWGNDATDEWWIDELERFAVQTRSSGVTRLLTLRLLAGSALFYSAGIAATAARRYTLLARLLRLRRSSPFNGQPELLATALDADSTYAEAGNSAFLASHLRPVLRDALGIGNAPLDDAWQTFEILRLATPAMVEPDFDTNHAIVVTSDQTLAPTSALDADPDDSGAREERRAAVNNVATRIRIHSPHVLAELSRGPHRYTNAHAVRLVAALTTEMDAHPFSRAGIGADWARLATAIEAVSEAIAAEADRRKWTLMPAQGGALPNAIWLDD